MCKYVVFDLEMCNVPYSVRKGTGFIPMETIQIGAVLVDEKLEIVDEFSTYVSPEKGWIERTRQRMVRRYPDGKWYAETMFYRVVNDIVPAR